MNPDTDTNTQNGGVAKGDFSNNPRYQLGIDFWPTPFGIDFRTNTFPDGGGDVTIQRVGSISINEWIYLTGTYDGSNMRAYLNGVQVGSAAQTGNLDSSTSVVMIGGRLDLGRFFPGMIDEVRVADVARSSGWIQTEYNNQNSPSSFYTFGSEEIGLAPGGSFFAQVQRFISVVQQTTKQILGLKFP